ncbi:MAG: hypothetical protein AAGA48_07015 [Myxococcota bacterium]
MAERWVEAARQHPRVARVREGWSLIVQAITLGFVDLDGLAGMAMQLEVGGDIVLEEVGIWPSGDDVIVEVQEGSATVNRAAFLDVLSAVAQTV